MDRHDIPAGVRWEDAEYRVLKEALEQIVAYCDAHPYTDQEPCDWSRAALRLVAIMTGGADEHRTDLGGEAPPPPTLDP